MIFMRVRIVAQKGLMVCRVEMPLSFPNEVAPIVQFSSLGKSLPVGSFVYTLIILETSTLESRIECQGNLN